MNPDNEERQYEETLNLLREAHQESIPEAHFAAVRARVLSQLAAEQQRPWRRWIWPYALVAAAAILAVAFWPKHAVERTRPSEPRLAVHQPPPAAAQPLLDRARVAPARRPRHTAIAQPPLAVHQPAPAAARPLPDLVAHAASARRPRLTAIAAPYHVIGPPAPPQPMVVKLITNDPNVVIYWITGE
jgi:hypothetical protein